MRKIFHLIDLETGRTMGVIVTTTECARRRNRKLRRLGEQRRLVEC